MIEEEVPVHAMHCTHRAMLDEFEKHVPSLSREQTGMSLLCIASRILALIATMEEKPEKREALVNKMLTDPEYLPRMVPLAILQSDALLAALPPTEDQK